MVLAAGDRQTNSIELEARVRDIDSRLRKIESRTTLDATKSILENMDIWFDTHHFLQLQQFRLELGVLGLYNASNTVRNAIWRAYKRGYLEKVSDGVYIRP